MQRIILYNTIFLDMSDDSINPFDFEKPVRDPEFFAGRKKQLKEFDYYLKMMIGNRPSYQNLSLIGKRAAGKTSMLYMIQYMAEQKNLLPVIISLDNDSSTNDVLLFKEIFDSIMTKGAGKNMFGGLGGKIYKTYRKVIDLLDASAEIPFLFGTAYIGTKKDLNTTISQHVMRNDLNKFFTEAKKQGIKGIVLLIDECDLLSSNETILQKMRHVFSTIDGYMLVFSGTEKMFPAFSKTFSPLPRIFKRINVENFKNWEETKECIVKRLSDNEKKLISDGTISEIHQITQGIPYEVQLISHFMYKKYRETKINPRIEITTDVLDEVMNEIERLRLGTHNEIANKIKSCPPQYLEVLRGVLEFPNSTIDQLSSFLVLSKIHEIEINNIGTAKSDFRFLIRQLKNGIIKEENNLLSFAGDQFDLLYMKYHLLSNKILKFLVGNPHESDINLANKINEVLIDDQIYHNFSGRFDRPWANPLNTNGKANKLILGGKWKAKPGKKGEWITVWEFNPQEENKKFHLGAPNSLRFRANVDFLDTGFVIQYIFDNPQDLKIVKEKLDSLKTKFEFLGIKLVLKDEIAFTLEGNKANQRKEFSKALKLFEEAIKINPNYELVWANMGNTYFQLQDYEAALHCFKKWLEIRPNHASPMGDIGRCLIHLHKNQEAVDFLNKATKIAPEVWSNWDNRGRALQTLGKYEEAIDSFDKAITLKKDDFEAIFFKGFCLSKIGKHNEAIGCYDKVLQNNPKHLESLNNKAMVLHILHQDKKAWKTIEKIGQKINDYLEFMITKSLILDGLNKIEEAIDCCDKILEKDSNIVNGWYNRSCFKVKMGQVDEGIEDLTKALQLDKKTVLNLITEDEDFDRIRDDERFKKLIATHSKTKSENEN